MRPVGEWLADDMGRPSNPPAGNCQAGAEGFLPVGAAVENGRGGIRTPETGVARLPVFKTGAFNRSATLPGRSTKASGSVVAGFDAALWATTLVAGWHWFGPLGNDARRRLALVEGLVFSAARGVDVTGRRIGLPPPHP
jgi:hypothetical protein